MLCEGFSGILICCIDFPLTEATVELSLDSPHNVRKKDVGDKPSASASASSLSAATSLTPSPSATLEEVTVDLNTPVCSSAVGQGGE